MPELRPLRLVQVQLSAARAIAADEPGVSRMSRQNDPGTRRPKSTKPAGATSARDHSLPMALGHPWPGSALNCGRVRHTGMNFARP